MITIKEAEDNVFQYIKPVAQEFHIDLEKFPEKQEMRGRAWTKEIILVGFRNKNKQSPSPNSSLNLNCSPINQVVTWNFDLILYTRSLRNDKNGAYCLLDKLDDTLSGKKLGNLCGSLYIENIQFTDIDDARFWVWSMDIKAQCKESRGDCYSCQGTSGLCLP